MRLLSLLRHAKSSWDDPVQRDFDRPLNARGRRAAVRMGQYLRDEGLHFDAVIASPAVRVLETLEGVEEGLGRSLGATHDRRIYMASAASLLDLVQGAHDVPHLLLVGHNPGLEDLVLLLTPDDASPLRAAVAEKYPTAALATLAFAVDSLAAVREGQGHLTRFTRPRDLDPSLGPDAREEAR
ncbi:MAG: SixA phosphatase family protein [Thermaurantiacus tibetensis]|uniref:SixA phosphatase family protein n=1 Tax=Thermaurantiacus tibetensis TaxID=2759035 RepID=UPI00188FD3EF|nr:histidine phosphatase family protein [Thermaurantiacus tibetensis]